MAGKWGGKYALSFDAYHAVPPEWQASSLLRAHEGLGGTYRLRGSLDRHAWYELADGIRAGDPACVELAVRFIRAHLIVSYAGFARQRLARALRHAAMTDAQCRALSAHFLKLLEEQERCHEFREYLDLLNDIAEDTVRERVLAIAAARPDDGFAQVIIRRMTHAGMPAAPQPQRMPRWFYARRRSRQVADTSKRRRWVDSSLRDLKRAADEAGRRFAAAKREAIAAELVYRCHSSDALKALWQEAHESVERARRELDEASRAFRAAR